MKPNKASKRFESNRWLDVLAPALLILLALALLGVLLLVVVTSLGAPPAP
ncbi:MAG: hypothetical protein L0Z70_09800 [Chloroflexi bacterium]|nr:hypothetical protein [Chloroflexota bacterium]